MSKEFKLLIKSRNVIKFLNLALIEKMTCLEQKWGHLCRFKLPANNILLQRREIVNNKVCTLLVFFKRSHVSQTIMNQFMQCFVT